METMTLLVGFIGALGIGTGIWGLVHQKQRGTIERERILFEKKLDAFSALAQSILGLALHEGRPKDLFENLAVSARARLLITDKVLDTMIHDFFIDLDDIIHTDADEGRFHEVQKEGLAILKHLSRDLNATLT